MASSTSKIFWLIVLLLPILLASGCLNQPGNTRFYSLLSSSGANNLPKQPSAILLVGPVTVTSYLDQPRLALRKEDNSLVYLDDQQWAGRLDEMFKDQLVGDLNRKMQITEVHPYPLLPPPPVAMRVTVRVLRFEQVDDQAVLEAHWSLYNNNKDLKLSRISVITEQLSGVAHLAAALGRTIRILADEIGQAVEPE